jgi:hypothetical protein
MANRWRVAGLGRKCGAASARRAVLTAVAVVAAVASFAPDAHANRPQITVAPVTGEAASEQLRQRMGQALTEGLIASGAEVPPATVEAQYVLRAKLEVDGRSYALRLEMLDRKSGAVVASREDRCEICTEAEAFETANTAASTLKALVFKRPGAGSGATASTTSVDLRPGATPGAGPSAVVESAPSSSKGHHGLGWAGIIGGVASAGAGTFLLGIDGKGTCDMVGQASCAREYETRLPGIGLIGLGAVLIGLGIWAVVSNR